MCCFFSSLLNKISLVMKEQGELFYYFASIIHYFKFEFPILFIIMLKKLLNKSVPWSVVCVSPCLCSPALKSHFNICTCEYTLRNI